MLLSSSPLVRDALLRTIAVRSAADRLPWIFSTIVTNGKMTAIATGGVYLAFLALWFPFWLLSFVVTEWGVYCLAVVTVFLVGRSIVRMIAFPGASQRVTGEIEREFAKYSVRMIISSCISLEDVASVVAASAPHGDNNDSRRRSGQSLYDLPVMWRRAKSYRDRVLGVFLDVLSYIYQDESFSHASNVPDLTRFGNNRLTGDIGDLSGLTPEARTDGRELFERLKKVLGLVDQLEQLAHPVLNAGLGKSAANPLTEEAFVTANLLLESVRELKDFATSLKPAPTADDPEDDSEQDLTGDALRRKVEEQSASTVEVVKAGIASVLPMLDPPPHTSVFGFDVQRGCMLSRYCGARQIWVRRPQGGMLDVLHFPARSHGSSSPRNTRAVLYCNPNAGLIEVAAGMSLVGGNVPSADADNSASDSSWTDFYTSNGIDVYVFNYAGYGRSFGTTLCVSGRNAGDNYHPGILARISRIIR
jgi:hypothetical protein